MICLPRSLARSHLPPRCWALGGHRMTVFMKRHDTRGENRLLSDSNCSEMHCCLPCRSNIIEFTLDWPSAIKPSESHVILPSIAKVLAHIFCTYPLNFTFRFLFPLSLSPLSLPPSTPLTSPIFLSLFYSPQIPYPRLSFTLLLLCPSNLVYHTHPRCQNGRL